MFEGIYASMILQNNDTIEGNARRRNQEQGDSRWTEKEKFIIAFTTLCYCSLIGITMFCFYLQYSTPVELKIEFDDEFGVKIWSQRVRDSWRTALFDYLNHGANTTTALADANGMKCPIMYSLSKDNKLCYFLAKTRIRFDYIPLLVNKTTAVAYCNSFSNGTVPYGKFMFDLWL